MVSMGGGCGKNQKGFAREAHGRKNIVSHEDTVQIFITCWVQFGGEVCVYDPPYPAPAETRKPTETLSPSVFLLYSL